MFKIIILGYFAPFPNPKMVSTMLCSDIWIMCESLTTLPPVNGLIPQRNNIPRKYILRRGSWGGPFTHTQLLIITSTIRRGNLHHSYDNRCSKVGKLVKNYPFLVQIFLLERGSHYWYSLKYLKTVFFLLLSCVWYCDFSTRNHKYKHNVSSPYTDSRNLTSNKNKLMLKVFGLECC